MEIKKENSRKRSRKGGERSKMKIILKTAGILLLIAVLLIVIINIAEPASHTDVDEAYKELISQTEYESDTVGSERVLSIDDSESALLWRLRMIAAAKESITMATFDLRADESGTDIMAALYDAAERGVKVQLLIDGVYEMIFLNGSDAFQTLCAHENVEARFYNPIRPKNLFRLNYRMHDKYIMVDDGLYLLGGRNTGDIFLGELHKGANIDRDILVYNTADGKGDSYLQLEDYFTQIWNESCVEEVHTKQSRDKIVAEGTLLRERYQTLLEEHGDFTQYDAWAEDTYEANRINLISNETQAGKKTPKVLYAIKQLALQSSEVLIQTPYVICDAYMYQVLDDIARDADVEMIINAVEKGSNPWGCTDYLNNKDTILGTGTTVYELANDYAVHTKTVLLDDNLSIVGSYNFDIRSTYLDTELMLVIDSEPLNAHIRTIEEEYRQKSLQVLPDGTEHEGCLYEKSELAGTKKFLFEVLRVVIRPIRHLL